MFTEVGNRVIAYLIEKRKPMGGDSNRVIQEW